MDALILPGGTVGAENLSKSVTVIKTVQQYLDGGKLTALICAAPIVLAVGGIGQGRRITSHPSVRDRLKGITPIMLAQ